MDLINVLDRWWLVLLVGSLLTVFGSFTRCAVAELVLNVAAHLYVCDPLLRQDSLEQWTGDIRELKPAERPDYAASLLWVGVWRVVTRSPDRRRTTRRSAAFSLLRNSDLFAIAADGVEIPVEWDEATDEMRFTTGYIDPETGRGILHFPIMDVGDKSHFVIKIVRKK